MRSVMKHDFSKVPAANIQRSAFNRSHGYKTTFDAGYLYPIFVDEALPGDTFNLKTNTFARMATPLFPIMDNLFAEVFFFTVPIRLVWQNFQKFMGEQDNPGDSTDFLVPTADETAAEGSLSDYFGIPTGVLLRRSNLWHRAYNLIWKEWFRDQNLQDSPVVDRDDGPDSPTDYVLRRRGKRHDYFTSSLPFPQKGPNVLLPLGANAPLVGTGNLVFAGQNLEMRNAAGGGGAIRQLISDGAANLQPIDGGTPVGSETQHLWKPGFNVPFSSIAAGMVADLADATAATINQLREAFQLQRLFERDARGGTRYTEIIRSHFGVVSDDARLQRPEFLGGGSTRINVNPVAQTSEDGSTPQGNLAAFATFSHHGQPGFTRSFTEHSLVIGLISVRADLNYQQGLNRMWSRSTRYDFYWPALANLGEQEVLNKEIYAQGTSADDDVFGYQERFAEYRYKPSVVTGAFRSNAAQSLDPWHLSQDFSALPALDGTFIEENPPVDRVIAVPSQPQFLLDCYFDFKTARPMPMYSVPGLIDHH